MVFLVMQCLKWFYLLFVVENFQYTTYDALLVQQPYQFETVHEDLDETRIVHEIERVDFVQQNVN